jgi:hypothetical protein
MVRPLCVAIEDGWNHVLDRGIERRFFFAARDYEHFLVLDKVKGEAASPRVVRQRFDWLGWTRIQVAVAEIRGQAWEQFCNRRGDPGRSLALWIGRRLGGYPLAELEKFVRVSYAAVAQAVAKLDLRMARDPQIKLRADQVPRSTLKLKT